MDDSLNDRHVKKKLKAVGLLNSNTMSPVCTNNKYIKSYTWMQLKPRLHQDTCVPDEQLVSGYIYVDCWRTHVAGYKLLVRDTCWLYHGNIYVTVDLYPSYTATDGQQTGNNFVADTRYMLTVTSGYKWIQLVSGNMCPGVNAASVYCRHRTININLQFFCCWWLHSYKGLNVYTDVL